MSIMISFMSPESHERIVGSLVLMSCQVIAQVTLPFDFIDLTSTYTIYQFVTSTTIIFSFINLMITFYAVRLWWVDEVVTEIEHVEGVAAMAHVHTSILQGDVDSDEEDDRWLVTKKWEAFKSSVIELFHVAVSNKLPDDQLLALKMKMAKLKSDALKEKAEQRELRQERMQAAGIEGSDSGDDEQEDLDTMMSRKLLESSIAHIERQLRHKQWHRERSQYVHRYRAYMVDIGVRYFMLFGAFLVFWTVFGQVDQHLRRAPGHNVPTWKEYYDAQGTS